MNQLAALYCRTGYAPASGSPGRAARAVGALRGGKITTIKTT